MTLSVTIPAFNEAKKLRDTVERLHFFLSHHIEMPWEIVIAENGSTDQTPAIAESLRRDYPQIRVIRSTGKGRGRALKQAWLDSNADILSYMDADLSTDLKAFPTLIQSLANGGFGLATGSRLLEPSLTTRSFKREFASRCYNKLVKALLRTHFSDAQCGFKAITRRAAEHLLPLVEDNGWFFDTELLVLAEKHGYHIFDLPVRWVENGDSHVHIFRTAMGDIKGLLRLRRKLRLEANHPCGAS